MADEQNQSGRKTNVEGGKKARKSWQNGVSAEDLPSFNEARSAISVHSHLLDALTHIESVWGDLDKMGGAAVNRLAGDAYPEAAILDIEAHRALADLHRAWARLRKMELHAGMWLNRVSKGWEFPVPTWEDDGDPLDEDSEERD